MNLPVSIILLLAISVNVIAGISKAHSLLKKSSGASTIHHLDHNRKLAHYSSDQNVNIDPSPINHININRLQKIPTVEDSDMPSSRHFFLNKLQEDSLDVKLQQTKPGNPNQFPKTHINPLPKDQPSLDQPHHFHINKSKKNPNPPRITCVDENDSPVDWIIFYKLPRVHASTNAHIVNGEAYMYVSSKDVKRFEESKKKKSSSKDDKSHAGKKSSFEMSSSKKKSGLLEKSYANEKISSNKFGGRSDGKQKVTNIPSDAESNKKNSQEKIDMKTDNDKTILNRQQWSYYPYSFHNTKYDTDSGAQTSNVDLDHEYTYYAFNSNEYDDNNYVYSEEGKGIMGKLKDALVKLFAKDASDQIEVERGDINEMDLENQAKLLKSELASGNGKRRFGRDTHKKNKYDWVDISDTTDQTNKNVYYWNDALGDNADENNKDYSISNKNHNLKIHFSDSISTLNDLLKARILKDSKDSKKEKKLVDDNGININNADILQTIRAIELLNGNEKSEDNEYNVEADRLDNTVDTRYDESQFENNATALDEQWKDKTRYEVVQESSLKEYNDANGKFNRETINKIDNRPEDASTEVPSLHGKTHSLEAESRPVTETPKDQLQWTLSSYSVRDSQSLPGKILSPYLFNATYAPYFSKDGLKILYNDQTPNSTTVKFGHSKGLVLGNSDGGIWIVHSIPHFVDDSQTSYNYPHTGLMYGQNFLCLSLNRSELDSIGHNLGHNQVYKYSTHMSDSNRLLYPTLSRIVDGTYATSGDNFFTGVVHTRLNEVRFRTFAKTRELGEDLYSVVGRDLNTSLLVETWPNGPGRLPTDCQRPGHLVENVEAINATGVVAFRSTHDHAKWTISFGNGSWRNNANDVGEVDDNRLKRMVKSVSDRDAILDDIVASNQFQEGDESLSHEKSAEMDKELSDADETDHNLNINVANMEDIVNNMKEKNMCSNCSDTNKNNVETTVDNFADDDLAYDSTSIEENSYPFENIEEIPSQTHSDSEKINQQGNSKNSELEMLNKSQTVPGNRPDSSEKSHVFTGNEQDFSGNSWKSSVNNGQSGDNVGYFVCNGDINRAEDQLKRGGGTVCVDNEALWGLYHSLIGEVEPCPRG